MKYFLDTEFHEYKKKPLFGKPIDTIELISIGIISEDAREYYAICKEFDLKAAWNNEWLRENVLLNIYTDLVHGDMRNHFSFSYTTMKGLIKFHGKTKKQIAEEVKEFCLDNVQVYKSSDGEYIGRIDPYKGNPQFYGYYADYDWVVFCWLFGRMIDLPTGFPMYCIDLKQELDRKQSNRKQLKEFIDNSKGVLKKHEENKLVKPLLLTEHPDYPKQTNEHNALADAKFNYELYKFLNTI